MTYHTYTPTIVSELRNNTGETAVLSTESQATIEGEIRKVRDVTGHHCEVIIGDEGIYIDVVADDGSVAEEYDVYRLDGDGNKDAIAALTIDGKVDAPDMTIDEGEAELDDGSMYDGLRDQIAMLNDMAHVASEAAELHEQFRDGEITLAELMNRIEYLEVKYDHVDL